MLALAIRFQLADVIECCCAELALSLRLPTETELSATELGELLDDKKSSRSEFEQLRAFADSLQCSDLSKFCAEEEEKRRAHDEVGATLHLAERLGAKSLAV